MEVLSPFLLRLLANPATLALIMQFVGTLTSGIPKNTEDGKPDVLLKYDVKWLQESLNTLLDESNPVTGKMNASTTGAVLRYQKKHPELVADGWPGLHTTVAIVADLEAKKRVQG